uniref:Uncharacterized protein n=1 Tax=Arundo donax TaxID=35708 RepID=A0A0A9I4G8_ARUDO
MLKIMRQHLIPQLLCSLCQTANQVHLNWFELVVDFLPVAM